MSKPVGSEPSPGISPQEAPFTSQTKEPPVMRGALQIAEHRAIQVEQIKVESESSQGTSGQAKPLHYRDVGEQALSGMQRAAKQGGILGKLVSVYTKIFAAISSIRSKGKGADETAGIKGTEVPKLQHVTKLEGASPKSAAAALKSVGEVFKQLGASIGKLFEKAPMRDGDITVTKKPLMHDPVLMGRTLYAEFSKAKTTGNRDGVQKVLKEINAPGNEKVKEHFELAKTADLEAKAKVEQEKTKGDQEKAEGHFAKYKEAKTPQEQELALKDINKELGGKENEGVRKKFQQLVGEDVFNRCLQAKSTEDLDKIYGILGDNNNDHVQSEFLKVFTANIDKMDSEQLSRIVKHFVETLNKENSASVSTMYRGNTPGMKLVAALIDHNVNATVFPTLHSLTQSVGSSIGPLNGRVITEPTLTPEQHQNARKQFDEYLGKVVTCLKDVSLSDTPSQKALKQAMGLIQKHAKTQYENANVKDPESAAAAIVCSMYMLRGVVPSLTKSIQPVFNNHEASNEDLMAARQYFMLADSLQRSMALDAANGILVGINAEKLGIPELWQNAGTKVAKDLQAAVLRLVVA